MAAAEPPAGPAPTITTLPMSAPNAPSFRKMRPRDRPRAAETPDPILVDARLQSLDLGRADRAGLAVSAAGVDLGLGGLHVRQEFRRVVLGRHHRRADPAPGLYVGRIMCAAGHPAVAHRRACLR